MQGNRLYTFCASISGVVSLAQYSANQIKKGYDPWNSSAPLSSILYQQLMNIDQKNWLKNRNSMCRAKFLVLTYFVISNIRKLFSFFQEYYDKKILEAIFFPVLQINQINFPVFPFM
ncbi:hypothetical protein BpHYR1_006493 [Brachionus plicatilis]|uniref:Uncharacterized protein n=1 Tax=Brachionus plicatilis TaxID=10195 RepID=A0A3M7PHK9_BRAPC|nr:hypothetical protein BpHYR1_006493 [Brachionus plicatilis]